MKTCDNGLVWQLVNYRKYSRRRESVIKYVYEEFRRIIEFDGHIYNGR